MTERPIIFSAPMIRALLDGRKTMTRRLRYVPSGPGQRESNWVRVRPGDRLWVRESHQLIDLHPSTTLCAYRANCDGDRFTYAGDGSVEIIRVTKWRPSIHCPRWASRLTLTMTERKIERLQDISRADAIAEGLRLTSAQIEEFFAWPDPHHMHSWLSPRAAFRWLWNTLHGAGAWESNPEIVALRFTVERRNIDDMAGAA
jgi:hypothetical protein